MINLISEAHNSKLFHMIHSAQLSFLVSSFIMSPAKVICNIIPSALKHGQNKTHSSFVQFILVISCFSLTLFHGYFFIVSKMKILPNASIYWSQSYCFYVLKKHLWHKSLKHHLRSFLSLFERLASVVSTMIQRENILDKLPWIIPWLSG